MSEKKATKQVPWGHRRARQTWQVSHLEQPPQAVDSDHQRDSDCERTADSALVRFPNDLPPSIIMQRLARVSTPTKTPEAEALRAIREYKCRSNERPVGRNQAVTAG